MDVKTVDEAKREQVWRFLLELPATSNSRIARIVGCDVKVVSQIRCEFLDSGEIQRTGGMIW